MTTFIYFYLTDFVQLEKHDSRTALFLFHQINKGPALPGLCGATNPGCVSSAHAVAAKGFSALVRA